MKPREDFISNNATLSNFINALQLSGFKMMGNRNKSLKYSCIVGIYCVENETRLLQVSY